MLWYFYINVDWKLYFSVFTDISNNIETTLRSHLVYARSMPPTQLNRMASSTGFPVSAERFTSMKLADLCRRESRNMTGISDSPRRRLPPCQSTPTTTDTADRRTATDRNKDTDRVRNRQKFFVKKWIVVVLELSFHMCTNNFFTFHIMPTVFLLCMIAVIHPVVTYLKWCVLY